MRYILIILLFCFQGIFANEILKNDILKYSIDKEYALTFSKLIVQSKDGRMKPLDTLNINILNKISQQTSFYELNHNQVILGMVYTPRLWKNVPMFNLSSIKLKKILKKDSQKVSYFDFFDEKGQYKLENNMIQLKNKKEQDYSSDEKELVKVNERVQITTFIYNLGFLKIFPLTQTKKWYSPLSLKENFKNETKYEAQSLFVFNKKSVINALETKNWRQAYQSLKELKKFQTTFGHNLIPSQTAQEAELFYNKYLFFEKLYPVYFFTSLFLLALIFIKLLFDKKIIYLKKILVSILILSFLVHTFALLLRWYISLHAPWSNAYESMIFISWCIILAGLFFVKKSEFALSSATLLGSVLLFVAHLSWQDPQISTLTPSLQSIWLTIHVAVISASYGFLALSLLLGLITLILIILNSYKPMSSNITQAFKTNELSMIIGLVLLTIGTLLGSVWANESWGRIWEWDPKETWSLASIFVYMMILHLRFIPKVYTIYTFSILSVLGYGTILMTYFGVNYFFDAIHVYASNSHAQIPEFTYYVGGIITMIILFAFKNREIEVKNG